jgi:Protein of unknown function (DUF3102)
MAKKTNARSLDVVANDIHKLARNCFFQIGELLLEAKDSCAHGEWEDWLEREFAWSQDTAGNYMNSARLAAKFRTVRDLEVPNRAIYRLGAFDPDDDRLPAIIKVLGDTAKERRLTLAEADELIELVHDYGDHPLPVLKAMDAITTWHPRCDALIEAIQKARPDTAEVAEQIAEDIRRQYEAENDKPDEATDGDEVDTDEADEAAGDDEADEAAAGDEADAETAADGDGAAEAKAAADRAPPTTELVEALKVVLHYAQHSTLSSAGGFTYHELSEIAAFVTYLREIEQSTSQAKRVADRAEARSRRNAANGNQDPDRWIES